MSTNKIQAILNMICAQLIGQLKNARCPVCGYTIYDGFLGCWVNGHIPYCSYDSKSGKVEAGYKCPRSDKPIIVYETTIQDPP